MESKECRVVAVAITHGERWKFLQQMAEAVLADRNVVKMIIVDNGSKNSAEIAEGLHKFGDRVRILKQEKNMGSAGGFAAALDAARGENADFVYISDDDMVPMPGFVDEYMTVRKFFPGQKVVICANRVDLGDNADAFFRPVLHSLPQNHTFFEVFSFAKVANFWSLLSGRFSEKQRGIFVPIVPAPAFVYGGAFLPIEAVREAPLPDASLFLYGDDIEYAWGIQDIGYTTYVAASVVVRDVDITFTGSHIYGLFDRDVPLFKIYYRLRNMVRLSVRHSSQRKIALFFSIVIWILGLCVIGLRKLGLTRAYFKRVAFIIEAIHAGYSPNRPLPVGLDL